MAPHVSEQIFGLLPTHRTLDRRSPPCVLSPLVATQAVPVSELPVARIAWMTTENVFIGQSGLFGGSLLDKTMHSLICFSERPIRIHDGP